VKKENQNDRRNYDYLVFISHFYKPVEEYVEVS